MNVRRHAFLVLLLAAIIAFTFFVRAWWLDQRRGVSAYVAIQLTKVLSADPRFTSVAVRRKSEEVVVWAPDTLQTSDRSALQRLIAEHGKPLDVHVLYLPEQAFATPSP